MTALSSDGIGLRVPEPYHVGEITMPIIVRRAGALGDVLCVTPVLRRLRKENPGARLGVQTGCPEALVQNPDIDGTIPLTSKIPTDARLISLDLAYEKRPSMHIVDAYFEEAFGDRGHPETKHLTLVRTDPWLNPRAAVIHAARSWASRTMPAEFWNEVARNIADQGLKPVFIGAGKDYGGPLWATNVIRKLRLSQVAALIEGAAVFIGSDSAMVHVAGTTSTPIVGIFTAVRGKYRIPYRDASIFEQSRTLNYIIEPDTACLGCVERLPPPITDMRCERGDNLCVRQVSAEKVGRAVHELMSLEDEARSLRAARQ